MIFILIFASINFKDMSDFKEIEKEEKKSLNFIEAKVVEDLQNGKNDGRVQTRFPPEPNGYLHIGHAKAICLDFGIAKKYNGVCNLRFDDTNPTKEDVEYVDSIKEDIQWLGFQWANEYYASDYFQQLWDFAIRLIKEGKAYIDEQTTASGVTNINRIDFGKILTSYDYIELTNRYQDCLTIYLQSYDQLNYPHQGLKIIDKNKTSSECVLYYTDDEFAFYTDMFVTGNGEFSGSMKIGGSLEVDDNIDCNQIKANDVCEAAYFNATSDKRAKNNFTHVSTVNALKWINDLKIYTFNYRSNGKSSIGITTQQVQDKPINDFNFVDNLEATGENGDYMTIKESKLVYMCMSAIQELSQQNQILQDKIYILQSQIDSLTYKS